MHPRPAEQIPALFSLFSGFQRKTGPNSEPFFGFFRPDPWIDGVGCQRPAEPIKYLIFEAFPGGNKYFFGSIHMGGNTFWTPLPWQVISSIRTQGESEKNMSCVQWHFCSYLCFRENPLVSEGFKLCRVQCWRRFQGLAMGEKFRVQGWQGLVLAKILGFMLAKILGFSDGVKKFRVQVRLRPSGLGFAVSNFQGLVLRFRLWGLGFRVGCDYRVQGLQFRIFRVQFFGFGPLGFRGFRLQGLAWLRPIGFRKIFRAGFARPGFLFLLVNMKLTCVVLFFFEFLLVVNSLAPVWFWSLEYSTLLLSFLLPFAPLLFFSHSSSSSSSSSSSWPSSSSLCFMLLGFTSGVQ